MGRGHRCRSEENGRSHALKPGTKRIAMDQDPLTRQRQLILRHSGLARFA